jgi:8-oxo-dGTP diphosphatase
MAICAIIVVFEGRKSWILLQQRGPGCPDYVGAWSHTCGYLDYDETLRGALAREINEELGINIEVPEIKVTEHSKNDQPGADPRQNVTIRYVVEIPKSKIGHIDFDSESRGGEASEVSGIKLLDISSGLPDLEFAFNHQELTKEILSDTRFFPDRDEIKLYDSISNAESGSWGFGGHRVLWILTRTPRGRVHVVIESLDIDTFWSENTPEFIQRAILDELALRRAYNHFEEIKRRQGPNTTVKQFKTDGTEIWMKVSDVLKVIEAGSLGPEDIIDPVDEFQIL